MKQPKVRAYFGYRPKTLKHAQQLLCQTLIILRPEVTIPLLSGTNRAQENFLAVSIAIIGYNIMKTSKRAGSVRKVIQRDSARRSGIKESALYRTNCGLSYATLRLILNFS